MHFAINLGTACDFQPASIFGKLVSEEVLFGLCREVATEKRVAVSNGPVAKTSSDSPDTHAECSTHNLGQTSHIYQFTGTQGRETGGQREWYRETVRQADDAVIEVSATVAEAESSGYLHVTNDVMRDQMPLLQYGIPTALLVRSGITFIVDRRRGTRIPG